MLYCPLDAFESAATLFPRVDFFDIFTEIERFNGEGRLTFEDGVYANIESYEPKRESCFESHRRYADIQIVLRGSEYIDVCPVSALAPASYDETRDISFYDADDVPGSEDVTASGKNCAGKFCKTHQSHIHMTPGNALLLLPEDAHKPCMFDGIWGNAILKCVIKIPVEQLKA